MTVAVAQKTIDTCFPSGFTPEWPEPIQRVQALAESGLHSVPLQYVKPESERPLLEKPSQLHNLEVPVIDLSGLSHNSSSRKLGLAELGHACEEWGFFQIINHGIPLPLLQKVRMVGRQFFEMPVEEKQEYANNPTTYEGYGSRLGVEKGAILDWGDYYYLNVLPNCSRDMSKWPKKPALWRETMEEYSQHVSKLSEILLEAISCTLDLAPTALKEAFGGEDAALSIRVNFYPACPQPELTLGLSAHSDPGGLTILLQDDEVEGLQVRHEGEWVSVKLIPGSLVVNLADQIQILSNGIYKSIEHRVVVNREKKRLSVATFCNPANELHVAPLKALTSESTPPLYLSMTFKEYRSFIRRTGTKGKEFVQSVQSPRSQYTAKRSLSCMS